MKKILFCSLMVISLFLFSNCGDDSTGCEFIGKWCQSVGGECNGLGIASLEFKNNGELIMIGNTIFSGQFTGSWESDDCILIKTFSDSGTEVQEYEIVSIENDVMELSPLGTFLRL